MFNTEVKNIPDRYSIGLNHIIKRLLAKELSDRPSVDKLLYHPLIAAAVAKIQKQTHFLDEFSKIVKAKPRVF